LRGVIKPNTIFVMAHPKIQQMLDLAELDVRRIRSARSSAAARKAWGAFLEHSNRALNRLEQYARNTGQGSRYKALIGQEIWADDLTRYVRTARNIHEHGVEDSVICIRFDERMVMPSGFIMGAPQIYTTGSDGRLKVAARQIAPMVIEAAGPGVRKVVLRPTIRMIPIAGRDGQIMPPVPQIEAEDEPEIAAAARIYLCWIRERIGTFR